VIYEQRTYTLHPGKVPEYLQHMKAVLAVREKYSKLVGFWSTEIGELNQVVHIWAYDDLAHRAEVRAAVAKEPEWQAFLGKIHPLLLRMESKILTPADFSPLR